MPGNATDTRIVQMQFDNRDFERNISTSEKSLDRFKQALDFDACEKSLEKFSRATKSLTFTSMAENLQKLTDKFTGLGTVSEFVLSKIRSGLEGAANKAKSFVESMTIDQINEGLDKFSQMNKNVQTIMAATGKEEAEVYRVLQRLNDYTDQTSYNFTDMAANIGKFTSVGIDLKAAERQMEGIANWAARSGGGIQEASRAMYNLSQAMGVGALTKIDWKSIENAGMATKEFKEQLMAAGVASGTLEVKIGKDGKKTYKTAKKFGKQMEVTYQNLAETLSKKWANTDTMQRAFEAYYYDFQKVADKTLIEITKEQKKILEGVFDDDEKISGKDWKTLEGQEMATNAVKQAAIDAAVEQGNLVKETTKDGKTIYKTAKKYGKEIEVTLDTFEASLETGWLDKGIGRNVWAFDNLAKSSYEAAQKCLTFTDVLNAWKDQLSTGWMQTWQLVFGDLSESMELFSNICAKVGDRLDELISFRKHLVSVWADNGGRNSLWSLIVGEVTDEGEAIAYEGAYGMLDIFNDIGKLLAEGFKNMLKIFATGDEAVLMDSVDGYMGIWLGVKFKNVTDNIREFIQSIKSFFDEVAPGQQKSRFGQLQDVVNALFSTFVMAKSVISDISGFVSEVLAQLTPAIDAIMWLLSELGLSISDTAEDMDNGKGLKVLFDDLLITIKPLTDAINGLFTAFSTLFVAIFQHDRENDDVLGFWKKLAGFINEVAKVIVSVATPIINFFADLFSIATDLFKNGFDEKSVQEAGEKLKASLKTMLDGVFSFIPNFSTRAKAFFTTIVNWFKNGFQASDWEKLKSKVKSLGTTIINALPEGISSGIKTVYRKIKNKLKKIWKQIMGLFDSSSNAFAKKFSSQSVAKLKNQTKSIWSSVIESVPEGITSSGKSMLGKVSSYVTNLFSKITGVFNKTKFNPDNKNVIQRVIDWIKTTYANLKSSLQKFLGNAEGDAASFKASVAKIVKWFEGLNWSAILYALIGIAGVAGIGVIVAKVIGVVKTLAGAVKTISDLVKNGLKIGVSETRVEKFGDKLLKIAGAIAILTACVVVIGNMKAEDAWRGLAIVAVMGALLAGISLLVKQIYKNMDPKNAVSAFVAMYGVAAAIGRMVTALLPLKDLNPDQLKNMLWGLTGVLTGLFLFSAMAKSGKLDIKSTAGVIAFCGGVWLIVNALLKVKDLTTPQLIRMGVSLVAILGSLLTFAGLLNKFGGSMNNSGMKEAAFLAASVGILVFSLLPLASMPWPKLLKMGVGLLGILAMLLGFTVAVSKLKASMSGSGMAQLLALAGSIMMISLAMIPLALLPFGKLAQATAAIVALMAAMFGFVVGVNKLASQGLAGSGMAQLLAVAGSIMMISLAMIPLALLPLGKLAQATATIVALMAAMFGFIVGVNKLGGGGLKGAGMVQLLALAAAIAAVVVVLMPLALMEWSQILKMGASLIAILAMFAIIIKVSKGLKVSEAAGVMLMLIPLAGLIFVFGSTLANLPKDLDWKLVAAFAVGLAALITAVGAVFALTRGNFSITGALKIAIGVSAVVAALLAVVGLMAPWLIGNIGGSLTQMSSQLALIGGMFSDFIGDMNTFSEGEVDSTKAKFNKIWELVKSLHDASGYIQAIHDFSECLLLLGSGLSQFMFATNNVKDPKDSNAIRMLEKLIGMKSELAGFTGGKHAADEIGLLGAGLNVFNTEVASVINDNPPALELLDKILAFGGRFSELKGAFGASIQMGYLGSALSVFATESAGITDSNPAALQFLTNLSGQATNLEKLASMDLTGFSTQMTALGGAMAVYARGAKEAAGIEAGETPDVTGAITILKSLTEGLSDEIGELNLPEIPSDTEFAEFGTQLAAMAGGLIQFAEAAQGLGDNTQKALDVIDFLASIKTKLTDDNIKAVKVFGDNGVAFGTLTAFGIDMVALGNSLKTYSEATKDFEKNQAALDTIDFFYELQNKLLSDSINASVFTILNEAGTPLTLSAFGLQISALGSSMQTYSESVKDFESNQAALDAIDFFYNLQSKLLQNSIDTAIFSFFSGTTPETMSQFGTDIAALGSALAGFATNVNFDNGEGTNFDNALKSLDALAKLSTELPRYGGLKSLWEGSARTLTELAGDIRTVGEAMAQFSDALVSVGTKSGKSYDTEMVKSALGDVQAVADILVTFASLAGDDLYGTDAFAVFQRMNDFIRYMSLNCEGEASYSEQAGGFIDNLVDFMSRFKEASEAAGIIGDMTIFEAFKNLAKGIQSMSAIDTNFDFKPIGLGMTAGLKLGIEEGKAGVVDAMVEVAVAAYKAAQEALNEHSPSRIFMSIGAYASEGLAIGIGSGENAVERASATTAQTAFDETSRILSSISDLLINDMGGQPTIRPVLDLSGITSGAGQINSMLNGNTYSAIVDPALSGRIAASVGTDRSYETMQTVADYSGIYAKFDETSSKITELGSQIAKMKLYLDTGALVGGVSDGVDANIGRKAFYGRRRN